MGEAAFWAGQSAGFIALALLIVAFASRTDERLLVILIFANVAFALQYLFLGSLVGAGLSALVILRILLARRYKGSRPVLAGMIGANLFVAALVWRGPLDLFALAAGLFGTYGMFALSGIPMRISLALAALCWLSLNLAIGSVGAALAEALALGTNLFTIARLRRKRIALSQRPA